MFVKIFAGLMIAFMGIVVGGLTGLSFYLWPTGFNDQRLSVAPAIVESLRVMQSEPKFGPDIANFYPGARDEQQRAYAQAAVDSAIASLIVELPRNPQRSTVLKTMKDTLANFDMSESEERDQVLAYLTKVMGICGVESSSELFNVWRYGFPYGWLM